EFVGRHMDGLRQCRRLVADGDGLQTADTRLHHAALVALTELQTVEIVEMNLDPRNAPLETLESPFDDALHPLRQVLATHYVVVRVDQHLHTRLRPIAAPALACDARTMPLWRRPRAARSGGRRARATAPGAGRAAARSARSGYAATG